MYLDHVWLTTVGWRSTSTLTSDGMKALGYNGSQSWDCSFAARALGALGGDTLSDWAAEAEAATEAGTGAGTGTGTGGVTGTYPSTRSANSTTII